MSEQEQPLGEYPMNMDVFRLDTQRPVPSGPGLGSCCPDQNSRDFETWFSVIGGLFYVCGDCGHAFWFDYTEKRWESEL